MRYTLEEPLETSMKVSLLHRLKLGPTCLQKYGPKTTATPSKSIAFVRKSSAFGHSFPPYFPLELNFANRAAMYAGPSVPLLPLYKRFGYLRW
jgi:hypothetical protein